MNIVEFSKISVDLKKKKNLHSRETSKKTYFKVIIYKRNQLCPVKINFQNFSFVFI